MLKDTHTEAVCPALSAGPRVTIKGIPNSSVNVSVMHMALLCLAFRSEELPVGAWVKDTFMLMCL